MPRRIWTASEHQGGQRAYGTHEHAAYGRVPFLRHTKSAELASVIMEDTPRFDRFWRSQVSALVLRFCSTMRFLSVGWSHWSVWSDRRFAVSRVQIRFAAHRRGRGFRYAREDRRGGYHHAGRRTIAEHADRAHVGGTTSSCASKCRPASSTATMTWKPSTRSRRPCATALPWYNFEIYVEPGHLQHQTRARVTGSRVTGTVQYGKAGRSDSSGLSHMRVGNGGSGIIPRPPDP